MWIADVDYTFCVTHFVKSKIVCKFVGRKALTQVSNVKMFHSKFYPSVTCPSGCVPAPLLGAHFASVFRKSSPMGALREPTPLWAHCASREQNVKLSKILPYGRIAQAESRMSSLRKSSPMGALREPRAECQACENPPLAGEVSAKPTKG